MGVIEGAILGGVIGAIVSGVTVYRMAQWQKKFLRLLEAGDKIAARRELERRAGPQKPQKSFPLAKLLQQRARVVGLWLLGEQAELAAELERHQGGPAYLANVEMFGLLALAVSPGADTAGLVARLDACAERVVRDSNKLQKLLRDLANLVARVGGGLAGRPVAEDDARTFLTRSINEPLLTRVLFVRTLILVAEHSGKPSLQLQKRLAAITTLFGTSAAA